MLKRNALLSSIMLLNPIAGLAAVDVQDVLRDSIYERQELIRMVFQSKKTVTTHYSIFNPETNSYDWVEGKVRYQIEFISTDPSKYEYYDGDGEMEYEVVVKKVPVDGNDPTGVYNTFFTKRLGDHKFKIFDCDSTSTCHEDYTNSVFYVFETPKGKVLKIKKPNEVFGFDNSLRIFHEVFE